MGRPRRIRDGVVDLADRRGRVAPGEPAGQIAAPDEPGQRRRRPVAGLGAGLRQCDRTQRGRRRLRAQNRRRHRTVARQIPRIVRPALHRRLFGDHVDDQPGRSGVGGVGRAVLGSAAAYEPVLPLRHRRHRVGSPLVGGARVVAADGRGDLIEAGVEREAGLEREPGRHIDHPLAGGCDHDVAVFAGRSRFADPGRIEPLHPHVDAFVQCGPGQLHPLRRPRRQRRVQPGQQVGIHHVAAAVHQRRHHPEVDVSGGEHRSDPRQALSQVDRQLQAAGCPAPADVQPGPRSRRPRWRARRSPSSLVRCRPRAPGGRRARR